MARPFGLVLAGGLGRRLGRAKGGVQLGGEVLAARAARVLSPLCRGVAISIRPGAANPAPGFAAIEDEPPAGRGPLSGLDAAFRQLAEADLLVLACDYPRVETALLERLLASAGAEHDVVVATDASRRHHPLVGLWRGRVAPTVREALASGRYAVGGVLRHGTVLRVGPAPEDPEGALLNLNDADDLRRLEGF